MHSRIIAKLALSLPLAISLSACQVETTNNATEAAPVAVAPSPPVQAAPAAHVLSDSSGPLLSGPVATISGSWNRGRDGLALAAMAREVNGMTTVCGVRATIGTDRGGKNQLILPKYRFFVGNTAILKGAQFYAFAPSPSQMAETPANCRVSNVPWSPEFAKSPWSLRYSGSRSF